jgi:hypothetical protein
VISIVALAVAAASGPIEQEPFLRDGYFRAALGMSTLSVNGTVPSVEGRRESRASGIWSLAMDVRAGVVIGKYLVLGAALHTTSSGANVDHGGKRESALVMFHAIGPFVAVYPAQSAGVHIGTTLGWGLASAGDLSGTGPAIAGVLGFDTRAERWSVHSFDFRVLYASLRSSDTRAQGFGFGFQYGIGFR